MTKKVAFVFPGQGSQAVGMGKTLAAASAVARSVFETADRVLGFALSHLCFEGPEAELRLTANTQPAILATSVALLRVLDVKGAAYAGHSLGEYTANVAAGTVRFEDALRIVRARGSYMQETVAVGQGAMAAVLGSTRDVVEQACEAVEEESGSVVAAVNYNAPGQIVIAGATDAVNAAAERIKAQGGKIRMLPVSAPFHCALMRPAEERLTPHLRDVTFTNPHAPIYANVSAEPLRTGLDAREALIRQVSRPVRWEDSVRRMKSDGITTLVEIGPGQVLTGLCKRIDPTLEALSIQSLEDIERVRAAIA